MKLITCLSNFNDIDEISFVDEIIISTKYSIYYDIYFKEEEIAEIIKKCNDLNIKALISIDSIIPENKISEIYDFLNKFIKYQCDFIFTDFAILSFFKEKNQLNRLIYSASTYVCNRDDIKYYQDLGIRTIISNELSLDDLIENCKYDNVILQTYGYYPIYYSKRNVLSLFSEYANIKIDINKAYEIKEEQRDEKYIIKEYHDFDNHSIILNAYKLCIYKELNDINPKYIYVNTNNLDVLKIYKEGIDKNNFTEMNELALKKIDGRIDKSLIYIRPSILNKDEKN